MNNGLGVYLLWMDKVYLLWMPKVLLCRAILSFVCSDHFFKKAEGMEMAAVSASILPYICIKWYNSDLFWNHKW